MLFPAVSNFTSINSFHFNSFLRNSSIVFQGCVYLITLSSRDSSDHPTSRHNPTSALAQNLLPWLNSHLRQITSTRLVDVPSLAYFFLLLFSGIFFFIDSTNFYCELPVVFHFNLVYPFISIFSLTGGRILVSCQSSFHNFPDVVFIMGGHSSASDIFKSRLLK